MKAPNAWFLLPPGEYSTPPLRSHQNTILKLRGKWFYVLGTMLLGLGCMAPAQAQIPMYQETFSGGNAQPTDANPTLITSYVGPGPTNMTYTSSPTWTTNCNGLVASWSNAVNSPTAIASCGGQIFWNVQQGMALALGAYNAGLPNGQPALNAGTAATQNEALTAFTQVAAPNPSTIIQNATPIGLPAIPAGGSGRFVSFSFTAVAVNCNQAHPLVQFWLNGTQLGTVGGSTDLCTDGVNPRTYSVPVKGTAPAANYTAGTYYPGGAGARLVSGSAMTFAVINTQASGAGNDWAWDNFTALDVTPTVSKAVDGLDYIGQTKRLTFTVTNTADDNDVKNGWAFTDTLPAGVVVASPPNVVVGGTAGCTATTTGTAAGSSNIVITNGNLPAGTATGTATACTIAVDVVSNTPGVYTNNASNFTSSVGLNLPTSSTPMEWVQNTLTVSKISNGGTGTFAFSGNNGIANHSITTTTPGAGVAGPQQVLTAASATSATTLSEAALAGWQVSGMPSCTGAPAGMSYDAASRTISLPALPVVSGGSNVQCTFVNQGVAQLTLIKTVSNTGGGTATAGQWTLSAAGPSTISGAMGAPAITNASIPIGTYTLSETGGPAGYIATGPWSCDTVPVNNNQIDLALGQAANCTVNNAFQPAPGITLSKTAGPASVPAAGSVVTYTFQASNTGNVPLANVTVTDPLLPGLACTPTTLAVGATVPLVCTGNTHTVTQVEINARGNATPPDGVLHNQAQIAGTPPTGPVVSATASAGVTLPPPQPLVSISKSADAPTVIPGGVLHYTVVVTNTGTVAANGTTVSDPIPAGIAAQSWTCAAAGGATCTASGTGAVTDTIATFPAGATATYTITATVSNAPPATVTNTASSTPGGAGVCAPGNTAAPCTAAVTLGSAPIIEVTKTADTAALVPGGTVHYTVTVSNSGASAADNVLITDPQAGGITSQSWTCTASGGAACPQASGAGGINQTVVLMPSGSSVVYTITASISNTPPTNVSNSAVAMPSESGTVCGPTNTPGPCSATASVPPLPQVSIVKSANVTTVVAGGTIVYTIVVSNSGVMPANNTAVSDPIPAGITSQSWSCVATGGATCAASGTGAITDTIATFPAGSFVTYTVTAQVSATPPATIGNTAVATPPAGTLCTPGNTASPCSASAAVSPNPQISVAKSVDAPTIAPGGVVHYTVSVTNNGSVAADGTTVSDPVPAGITAQSWTCAAQAGATCTTSGTGAISDTLATFPPSSFVTYTVTATVSATPPATIANTASSTPPSGTCAPGNTAPPCTATTSSTPLPQVQISKSANIGTLIPGGTVTYTVVVKNTSAVAANGTTVSDPIPAGIAAQSWTCAAAGGATCTASGTGAVTDTIATFPAGATATYTITATVSNAPPATVTNTASSTPGGAGVCAPGNTAAPCTAAVTLGSAPIIEVTKTADTSVLAPGSTVHYTVTISNTGSVAADGTTVSDAMPVGIASQSWACSATGGATCTTSGGGAITDTRATFPAGAIVT